MNHRHFHVQDRGHACDNPGVRLLAAVLLRAVRDYYVPTPSLNNADRESAAAFLWSETGRNLMAHFLGVADHTVQARLLEAKGRIRKIRPVRAPGR
jgi:hypothetical protein